MVGHGNRGEGAGYGKVRKLGCINQGSVDGSICGKLPAESAAMWQCYVIHRSDNVWSSGSEIERPHSFWMQLSIHRNDTLAVNNGYMIMYKQLLTIQRLLGCIYSECQRSVDNFPSYAFSNQKATSLQPCKVKILVALIGKKGSDTLVTPS